MHVELSDSGQTCGARVIDPPRSFVEAPCGRPAAATLVLANGFRESACLAHARTLLEGLQVLVRQAEERSDA